MSQQKNKTQKIPQRQLDISSALTQIAQKIKYGTLQADAVCLLFVTIDKDDPAKFNVGSYANGLDAKFAPLVLSAAAEGFKKLNEEPVGG